MPLQLTFPKSGAEIKQAIGRRLEQLQTRLAGRSRQVDELMDDRRRLRSYLIRSTEQPWVHGARPGASAQLAGAGDISSEERDEIRQLCTRVNQIEQEIKRLTGDSLAMTWSVHSLYRQWLTCGLLERPH